MNPWNSITVTELDSIITVHSPKGRHLEMRNRRNYGLSFCIDAGKIIYTKDGKKYESDRSHAILLPMGESYSLSTPETGDFPLINFSAAPDFSVNDFIVIPLSSNEIYLKDYERLREAWLVRHDRAKSLSILYEIFSRLAREEQQLAFLPLLPAVKYLTEHFSDPTLSSTELTARTGLSEVYFRRRFKEYYGVPPKQYLLELRIRHACLLLAETNKTVTTIAESCGFSSVYHFCRAFRNAVGETPTEYRHKERF